MMPIALATLLLAGPPVQDGQKKTDPRAFTRTVLLQVSTAVDIFYIDHGRYPGSLKDLLERPKDVDEKRWTGAYLTKPPKDGWGRDVLYRVPGGGDAPYDLLSLGSDGAEGGTGDAADIPLSEARPRRR